MIKTIEISENLKFKLKNNNILHPYNNIISKSVKVESGGVEAFFFKELGVYYYINSMSKIKVSRSQLNNNIEIKYFIR